MGFGWMKEFPSHFESGNLKWKFSPFISAWKSKQVLPPWRWFHPGPINAFNLNTDLMVLKRLARYGSAGTGARS